MTGAVGSGHSATRDPFGLRRVIYRDSTTATAPSVRALLALERARHIEARLDIDIDALVAHLDGSADRTRTFLRGVRALAPGPALASGRALAPGAHAPAELGARVAHALRRCLAAKGEASAAVALSGGLDSAIILAIARAIDPRVPAYILAPAWRDYAETDAALATAEQFGGGAVVVDVGERDFLASLPAAIAAFEEPIYNAHPVAKLLLAQRLQRDGIATVVTGDGADHVMRRDQSADYLPLVNVAFTSCEVALCAPFLDDAVVALLLQAPPDPDKQIVRDVGRDLGVHDTLVSGPKRSKLAPPIGARALVGDAKLARLGALLGRTPPSAGAGDDRAEMRWCTTSLLLDAFGLHP